jgi:Na+-translocating ferredoxin:NAD+ oxidoreductase subunit B
MDIILPIVMLGITGLILGGILAYASKVFEVINDPKVEEALSALPGVNCGACGYPGCSGYAEAVIKSGAAINLCAPGGSKTVERLAEITGSDTIDSGEKRVARVMCQGDNSKTGRKYEFDAELKSCATAMLYFAGDKKCEYGCMGYGDCEKVCPFDAIFINEKGIAVVDEQRCTACGKCVSDCPKKIIKLLPETSRVSVLCSSKDDGQKSRKICTVSCIACGICVKNCPVTAIKIENNLAHIDSGICTNCGICSVKCPTNAIKNDIKEIKKAVVIEDKCIGCTICSKNCPVGAIEGEIKKKHKVIEEKCTGCEICYEKCPVKAIEMKIFIEKEY